MHTKLPSYPSETFTSVTPDIRPTTNKEDTDQTREIRWKQSAKLILQSSKYDKEDENKNKKLCLRNLLQTNLRRESEESNSKWEDFETKRGFWVFANRKLWKRHAPKISSRHLFRSFCSFGAWIIVNSTRYTHFKNIFTTVLKQIVRSSFRYSRIQLKTFRVLWVSEKLWVWGAKWFPTENFLRKVRCAIPEIDPKMRHLKREGSVQLESENPWKEHKQHQLTSVQLMHTYIRMLNRANFLHDDWVRSRSLLGMDWWIIFIYDI